MKILACQLQIPPVADTASRDAHLAITTELLSAQLHEQSADLVVLPELSSIDYSRRSFERMDELAEDLDGPTARAFGELAHRHTTHVAFGFAQRVEEGFRICHAIVGPGGDVLGSYQKLHMAQFGDSMEKEFFGRGERLLVVDVGGVRIAPIICYDFRFPELSRRLSITHGVDLIIHPVAFSNDASYASWHPIALARAIENQIYFLSLNRAGEAYGGSIFCPPWKDGAVQETVFGKEQQLAYLDVDRRLIAQIRKSFPFRTDRLSDYHSLPADIV